ncbi:MAG: hypothetical protein IPI00_04610 [Flavobacteriales bacterium]|nr:hypothetical protein [Flavobacteriales bacterium]MBK6945108.1 hypothetical protein [Flavobacteriales bacterium]MBK7239456.1 hypothetical protein [Flavobacteriales bacterium]MBK7296001.1 hypothetical protein [Flavobacteriales bacterium]HQV51488.1 hypothetical protein [Flavobacteriales bacterium]
MTIGKKYAARTKDTKAERILDERTRSVLNAILTEPKGNALSAYLRTRSRS